MTVSQPGCRIIRSFTVYISLHAVSHHLPPDILWPSFRFWTLWCAPLQSNSVSQDPWREASLGSLVSRPEINKHDMTIGQKLNSQHLGILNTLSLFFWGSLEAWKRFERPPPSLEGLHGCFWWFFQVFGPNCHIYHILCPRDAPIVTKMNLWSATPHRSRPRRRHRPLWVSYFLRNGKNLLTHASLCLPHFAILVEVSWWRRPGFHFVK